MTNHELFAALGDATRLEVLNRLATSGPATATELSSGLPISRQAVAKHLTALNEVGLVERRRVGREVRFSFDPTPLDGVVDWARGVGAEWDRRLDRLRKKIEDDPHAPRHIVTVHRVGYKFLG